MLKIISRNTFWGVVVKIKLGIKKKTKTKQNKVKKTKNKNKSIFGRRIIAKSPSIINTCL